MRFLSFAFLLLAVAATTATAAETVSFPTVPLTPAIPQVKVTGTLAKPKGTGPFPAVVLLHSCGGLLHHVTRDWPEVLNELGYATLTVNFFSSRGMVHCPNAIMSKDGAHLDVVTGDAYGALDYLASRPDIQADRVAVMGFSFGGLVVNLDITPRNMRSPGGRQFKAAAALYGVCASPNFTDKVLGRVATSPFPLLELIPTEDEPTAKTCAHVSQPWIEKHELKGAYHSFDVSEARTLARGPMGGLSLFNAAATEESHKLVQQFLARTMAP